MALKKDSLPEDNKRNNRKIHNREIINFLEKETGNKRLNRDQQINKIK